VVDLLSNHIGFGAALRSFFHLCQQKLIARGTAVTERFQSATREPRHGAQQLSQMVGTAGIKRHTGAPTHLRHALEDCSRSGIVAFLKQKQREFFDAALPGK